jgi:hypothetical protein
MIRRAYRHCRRRRRKRTYINNPRRMAGSDSNDGSSYGSGSTYERPLHGVTQPWWPVAGISVS